VTAPLSVVVPTRDRADLLQAALAALTRSLRPDDQLIVVDSASRDARLVARSAADVGAHLVRCDVPGAARARNAGWAAAANEIVVFVDDDVVVDERWAAALAAAMADHPEVAFVTGRIEAPPESGTMTVAVKTGDNAAVIDRASTGVLGHSASLAVRRTVLAELGGFDELLGAGARWRAAEDTDLFDRILAAGHVGRYEPAARATHEQWRRIREWVRLQHSYGIGSGARLAKLWRTDRDRWRQVFREDVVTWGIAQLPGEVARLDGYRALATGLRLAGVFRGFVAAINVPIHDGHFGRASNSS
jgi:glycosyltransferase involved in cell wall biosynthesis